MTKTYQHRSTSPRGETNLRPPLTDLERWRDGAVKSRVSLNLYILRIIADGEGLTDQVADAYHRGYTDATLTENR